MAVGSSAARQLSSGVSRIFLLFVCLASLVSSTSSGSSLHLEPNRWTDEDSHGQGRLSIWRKASNRIIQKILSYPDSVKSLASTSPLRVGDGQPTRRLRTRYSDDIVIRFNYSTVDELGALAEVCDVLFLDVWEKTDNFFDIRLSKDTVTPLLSLLPESLQRAHFPIMQDLDLAQAVYNSYPQTVSASAKFHNEHFFMPKQGSSATEDTNTFFQNYQPLSVILPWMRLLESLFPNHVRITNVGKSYEGRHIAALRIGVHPTSSENPLPPTNSRRKTIIITGGSHAREWISTSSVNYVAYSLATQYGKSSIVGGLVESFNWIFIPTLNPDGYVYTWNEDRLWRKNRQSTSLQFCSGIDLDRSYGYHWDGFGTSDNPCSESFAGEEPFQAVETGTFVDWVRNETSNNNAQIVGFLDLHSYSQEVLYPYSYSCVTAPPSLENLQELAMGIAKAIRLENGHYYKVVSACGEATSTSKRGSRKSNLPQGGGSALDWFYGEMGVRPSFQIKLRDTGSYGFLLPKEHIVPTGKEVFAAILYLGQYLKREFDLQAPKQGRSMATNFQTLLKSKDKQDDLETPSASNSEI